MNKLIHHIDFLLHSHSIVIVPGFGSFMLNYVPASKIGISEYPKPAYELSFNEELKDNDSLLVESYMKHENLLLKDAFIKIENTVEEIKQKLNNDKHIEFGKLGSFSLNDENQTLYTPGRFEHPTLFGLEDVTFKPIVQLQTETVSKVKRKSHKSVFGKIAVCVAVLAAAALFTLISVDMLPLYQQNANILPKNRFENLLTGKSKEENKANVTPSENKIPETVASAALSKTLKIESVPVGEQFYIVVGVYNEMVNAQNLLDAIKANGFNNASILKRGARIDVYIDVFNTPDEAYKFTQKIQKEFSEYKRAWVLKYKN